MKIYLIESEEGVENIAYYNKEQAKDKIDELNEEMAEFELYREEVEESCYIDYEGEESFEDLIISELPELYKKFGKDKLMRMYEYFNKYIDWYETPLYKIKEIDVV